MIFNVQRRGGSARLRSTAPVRPVRDGGGYDAVLAALERKADAPATDLDREGPLERRLRLYGASMQAPPEVKRRVLARVLPDFVTRADA